MSPSIPNPALPAKASPETFKTIRSHLAFLIFDDLSDPEGAIFSHR